MAIFRLLAGQHIQADPNSPVLTPEQVKAGARRPSKTFNEGETIESEDDLVAKHGAAKFVLVSGSPKKEKAIIPKNDNPADVLPPLPLPQTRDEAEQRFQRMNVVQLKAFASERGIDLTGKVTKAEIIEHIIAVLDD